MANSEGLGIGYRLWWNFRRAALSVFGPAQLGDDDPIQALREERRRKVAEARSRQDDQRT